MSKIFTHDEAAKIVELFEDVLSDYGIKIPSPEDDERETDNAAVLYGSVYSGLLDSVENKLIDLLDRCKNAYEVITDRFSGTW